MTAPATDPRPDDDDGNPFLAITGPVTKTGGSGDGALAAPPEPANDDDSDNPFLKITGPVAPATSAGGAFARGVPAACCRRLGPCRRSASARSSVPPRHVGRPLRAAHGSRRRHYRRAAGGFLGAERHLRGPRLGAVEASWNSWTETSVCPRSPGKARPKYHGTASFLGALRPMPSPCGRADCMTAALPDNATALQRIMAHPATAHVFRGAVMGGMELGQEAAHGDAPDWSKVAISTAFGVVFNRPTRIGETLIDVGRDRRGACLVRPEPAPAAAPQPPAGGPESAPRPEGAARRRAPPAPPADAARDAPGLADRNSRAHRVGPSLRSAPDCRRCRRSQGYGTRRDEDVFLGSHAQDPAEAPHARRSAPSSPLSVR